MTDNSSRDVVKPIPNNASRKPIPNNRRMGFVVPRSKAVRSVGELSDVDADGESVSTRK